MAKMTRSIIRFILIAGAVVSVASTQTGAAAKLAARHPPSRAALQAPKKGAPTGEQMTKGFICQEEGISGGGDTLHLLTDVIMQVGKARPFQMSTDAWPDSDPSQPVYPVQGGYTQ